ncbi:Uncharacterised protein [Chlamydia trachomatis]|nr:Uncharacterised protein [Chlamydia trachomatis]
MLKQLMKLLKERAASVTFFSFVPVVLIVVNKRHTKNKIYRLWSQVSYDCVYHVTSSLTTSVSITSNDRT